MIEHIILLASHQGLSFAVAQKFRCQIEKMQGRERKKEKEKLKVDVNFLTWNVCITCYLMHGIL